MGPGEKLLVENLPIFPNTFQTPCLTFHPQPGALSRQVLPVKLPLELYTVVGARILRRDTLQKNAEIAAGGLDRSHIGVGEASEVVNGFTAQTSAPEPPDGPGRTLSMHGAVQEDSVSGGCPHQLLGLDDPEVWLQAPSS